MAFTEEGKTGRHLHVVSPCVTQQAAEVAERQAVVRCGKIGQHEIGGTTGEQAAEGLDSVLTLIQSAASDGIACPPQCGCQRPGRAARIGWNGDQNLLHVGVTVSQTDTIKKASRTGADVS